MSERTNSNIDPNELMPCGKLTRLDYAVLKNANPVFAARYASHYRLYESGFRDLVPDTTNAGSDRLASLRPPPAKE